MAQTDRSTGLVGNAAFKVPVQAATTVNITLTGEQTVDGVVCVTGDRVLVKNQTDASENGIWVVDTGAWARAPDFDGTYDAVQGTVVTVNDGTQYKYYEVTTADPFEIGTDDIAFGAAIANASSSVSFLLDAAATETTVQEHLRQTGIISANADYGCVGDDATDNKTQLYKMRDFMRANPRPWTVNFDPNSGTGVYRYSGNLWTKGVRDLTINANGCTFKCTDNGATWSFNKNILIANQGVFSTSGYVTYDGALQHFGYKIASALDAAVSVTTSVVADAGNFAVGDPVLIYGYGQQNASYPPNPRYFEWNEVVSADAGTGVITLKRPLAYRYDSAWHDFVAGKGAPRILNLNHSNFTWGNRLEINGGVWGPNTTDATSGLIQIEGYERAILNNVRALNLTPTVCRYVELNDCNINSMEIDKVIEEVHVKGGTIKALIGGTGCRVTRLTGDVKVLGLSQSIAHNTIIDGATLSCLSASTGTEVFGTSVTYAVALVDIRAARFVVNDAAALALLNGGIETTFTLSSVSSNTKVLVLCATEAAFETVYQQLREGFTYQLQDGTKRMRITKIYDEDATHAAIEGVWSAVPVGAEVYRGANIGQIKLGNIEQVGTFAPVKAIRFARQQYHDIEYRNRNTQLLTFSSADIPVQASGTALGAAAVDFIVRGYVTRIFVIVTTAYTGADPTNLIVVAKNLPAAVNVVQVSGKTLGPREATCFATNGAVAGDTLLQTDGAYFDTLRIFPSKGGGLYPVYADVSELAKYIVMVEVMKSPS